MPSLRPLSVSILLSVLLPLTASASCGFTQGEEGMTIVVGSKNNRCFDSGEFREAFRSSLVASVQEMDGGTAVAGSPAGSSKRAFDHRNPRSAKLWSIAERRHQASLANARYFGQR